MKISNSISIVSKYELLIPSERGERLIKSQTAKSKIFAFVLELPGETVRPETKIRGFAKISIGSNFLTIWS